MNVFKKILNGTFLQRITGKNLLFIGLIVLLFVIYIGARYNCYSMVMQINRLDRERRELKSHSFAVKTIYQNSVSMNQISHRLTDKGIQPSKEPVKDIIIIK